jgi:hypothetical protein
MTPVHPVPTSSAALPRRRRPSGLRGTPVFRWDAHDADVDQLQREETALPAVPSVVLAAEVDVGGESTPDEIRSLASHAFARAAAHATAEALYPGRFVDLLV